MSGTDTTLWKPRRAVLVLCTLALALYLTLNSFAFAALGIHYESEGGNPLVKIHPGTMLIVLAVLIHGLSAAHPMRVLTETAQRTPSLVLCAAGMLVLLALEVALHGPSGVAYLADTYVAPAFLTILIAGAPPRYLRGLFVGMVVILIANACLGVVEARLHWHLFPYVIDGQPVTEDYFRATALEGHPLRNALLTGLAMIAVMMAAWPLLVRAVLLGPLAMGMLAFGGRASLMIAVLGCVVVVVHDVSCRLRSDPHGAVREVWAGIALVLVGAGVIGAAFYMTNFGGRIRAGDFTDSSSAARLQLFSLLRLIDTDGLLGGYDAKTIQAMTQLSGLVAIENFWVFNLLFLGIVGFAIWAASLAAGCAAIWQRSRLGGRVMLACFLVMASSNNSLAKKDSSLSVAFAFMIAAAAVSRAAQRVPAGWRVAAMPRHGAPIRAA